MKTYKIGDEKIEIEKLSGDGLIRLKDDTFIRPSDFPRGQVLLEKRFKLLYEYPSVKERPHWVFQDSRVLDELLTDDEPPKLPWWRRLFRRKSTLPEARLLTR